VPPSDTGPNATEHAIFAAVLEHEHARDSVVEAQTVTWNCLGTIAGLFSTLLQDETVENFFAKNNTSYALDQAAMAGLGCPLTVGNAKRRISLSRAGLNAGTSQALVCTIVNWFLGGAEGFFWLLENRSGRWSVRERERVWTILT
jgi:hypothetical protein